MSKKTSILSKISSFIFIVFVIVALVGLHRVYKTHYYNDFSKAEENLNTTKFTRDSSVKYSDAYSYKLESKEYNDAMFYKTINVEKNTSYRVTCMIKTENVVAEKEISSSGAQICLYNTVYASKSITGTTDWQEVEFIFNSRNNDTVDIGFRLGGNNENCKGTAWFSDFKLEKGTASTDTNWNMVCFICKNVDVDLEQDGKIQKLRFSMNNEDIQTMKDNMLRLKNACSSLSDGKMSIDYKVIEIDEPITSVSYDSDHGYYVDPIDVKNLIDPYISQDDYDHIFIAVRLGDMTKEIPVYDWIGLGGMDYYGIGFSNIRLPNDSSKSYTYKYNSYVNVFPEEVFLHEFLHSLERDLIEYGYEIPALHDNEKYGYDNQPLIGLKNWYKAYMTCSIWDSQNDKYVGLDEIVYKLKPSHKSDFKNTEEVEFVNEPKNIIDDIVAIFKTISRAISEIRSEK